MKKLLLFAVALVALMGCSKEDNEQSAFPTEVSAALQTLNGTFTYRQGIGTYYETITFKPFTKPTGKLNPLSDVPTEFHGVASVTNSIWSKDYYFYVSPSQKRIVFWGVYDEKPDYYAINASRDHTYEIIDGDSFRMKDNEGSTYQDWNVYKRD